MCKTHTISYRTTSVFRYFDTKHALIVMIQSQQFYSVSYIAIENKLHRIFINKRDSEYSYILA